MRSLRILHLYPEELGIFGDVGNVLALRRRAEWRGIPVEVLEHRIGDPLPESVELIHIGNGPVSGQRAVHQDLLRIAPGLRSLVEDGAIVLAVAAGWQLLGRELVLDGESLAGAGVFASRAVIGPRRFVGNLVAAADGLQIMGFENHAAVTELLDGAQPFATGLSRGFGNMRDGVEGIRRGASIGTNLGGPVLALNPELADAMLGSALEGQGIVLPAAESPWFAIVDENARKAREAVANAVQDAKGWLVAER